MRRENGLNYVLNRFFSVAYPFSKNARSEIVIEFFPAPAAIDPHGAKTVVEGLKLSVTFNPCHSFMTIYHRLLSMRSNCFDRNDIGFPTFLAAASS